jgi:trehalose synthase
VTSLTIERLDPPSSTRGMRALDATRRRAADALAGRTVWCAAALPQRRASAQRLRACLQWGGGGGVTSGLLEIAGDEPLRELAERLQAMLECASPSRLGGAEREICADGVHAGEELVGAVGPDDVVVAHDPLTALLAEAVRDRGAHAVWHLSVPASPRRPIAERARSFLRRYTFGIDAYVTTWSPPAERPGAVVERIAALMPGVDAVVAKEIPAAVATGEPPLLAWSTVLADVVRSDRDETVGGTLHSRPTVPVR